MVRHNKKIVILAISIFTALSLAACSLGAESSGVNSSASSLNSSSPLNASSSNKQEESSNNPTSSSAISSSKNGQSSSNSSSSYSSSKESSSSHYSSHPSSSSSKESSSNHYSSHPSSSSEQPPVEESFTVRWVNYNGSVLQTMRNVSKGTTVHYPGWTLPKRPDEGEYTYTFSHWEPEEGPIYQDTTYTAVYDQAVKTYLKVNVKRNETYGFYTLELEHEAPEYTFDYRSLNDTKYTYDSEIPEDYPEYNSDLVREVVFGDNIETVANMVKSYNLAKVVFSENVKSLKNALFNVTSRANEIVDVFFEGDCPTIEKGALKTNGGYGLRCYYHEGKQGFSESYIDGQPFLIYGKSYDLPEMTLDEYSLRAVKESRLLAKRIETLYKQNPDLMFYPFTNLAVYEEIKDFTLELTKDCHNQKDQAEMCYTWLIQNVTYDSDYTLTQLEEDWADRRAVCAGYTAIMHDMLASLGILSFYTRGIANYHSNYPYQDIALGNLQERGENHAWITAIVNDEVMIIDPTWGSYGYSSFDVSDEVVASRYITFSIDFINVVPEGFSYYMYEYITYLNDDNEIYVQHDGILTGGLFSTYNFKIQVNMTGQNAPYMVRNALYKHNDVVGDWQYALANGRLIPFLNAAYYEDIEKTRYGKTFQNDLLEIYLPNYTMVDGLLFKLNDNNTASIAKCFSIDEVITIPSQINGYVVNAIDSQAFRMNLHLKKVIIPDTVKRIEKQAFVECDGLEELTLSSNVEYIGLLAFAYCASLKELVLPDSLLELDEAAFSQCYSLENVTIGRNLKVMKNNTAFASCCSVKKYIVPSDNVSFKTYEDALYTYDMETLITYCNGNGKEVVTIPSSVKEINYDAFCRNENIKTINLNEGLEYIRDGAFSISSITSLIVPSTVKLVGGQAFTLCTSLTSIVMNCSEYALIYSEYDNVPFITNPANYENGLLYAGKVLLRCISTDEHVKIKEGTTNIAYGAYQNDVFNNGLYTKSVLLPSSLKQINDYAFTNAKKLEKVIMTNSIQKVYPSAFNLCPMLNEIIYVGTEEEFNKIEVDNRWNENTSFLSARKTFVSEVPEQYQ